MMVKKEEVRPTELLLQRAQVRPNPRSPRSSAPSPARRLRPVHSATCVCTRRVEGRVEGKERKEVEGV